MSFLRLFVSLVLLSQIYVYAQMETGEPLSTGNLSFIEDLPNALGEGEDDPRRRLPFVEVIDLEGLDTCKEEGFDAEGCPTFEYTAPFTLKSEVVNFEEALADEWLRFETRSYHRIMLEIGAELGLITCTAGLGSLDLQWFFLKGELFFPSEDVCDGFDAPLLPNCFTSCDIPLASCPSAPANCLSCITKGIARAYEHTLSTYYVDYTEAVSEHLLRHLPLALSWQSPLMLRGGSVITPVTGEAFPDKYVELATNTDIDARAPAYYLQSGAYSNLCQPFLPDTALELLRTLPLEERLDEQPGIPELEGEKRTLANRESAGSTYTRHAEWFLGEDHIYPKYTRDSVAVFGVGGEEAYDSATLPLLHSCFGYAVFFQVYQQLDTLLASWRPIQRTATCLTSTPPFVGVTLAPLVPIPWTFAGPRFHTDWVSVPEGYDIPRVEGAPVY